MARLKRPGVVHSVEQSAARLMPYKQGQFDSLCGLYAVLNALQLAAYPNRPLTEKKARSLFETGVAFLRREFESLNPVTHGMKEGVLVTLAVHLLTKASTASIDFSLAPYEPRDCDNPSTHLRDWIEQSLMLGYPVVTCIFEPAHFTVVSHVTTAGLILFDSQTLGWLPVPRRNRLHDLIDSDATLQIRVRTAG